VDTWALVARESLTIAGWVAMWRPMQIYLYDWWPLLRRGWIYAKLSHMPVEVLQKAKLDGFQNGLETKESMPLLIYDPSLGRS
jgi:hypothetical protein